ncbi:MAG: hypothetical protein ACLUFP_03420 [Streptococcus salivarius]
MINELWKVANVNWQQVSTTRHQQKTNNSLELVVKIPQYKFVGEVVDFDPAT